MKTSLCGGLVLLTMATGLSAQEPTLLRYQPSKEPLVYRRTSTMKQTQTIMDKKIITEMNQTEIDEWSIAATDKKDLEIKTETKRLQVKLKIAQVGDYTFDSRKDDNEKGSTLGAAAVTKGKLQCAPQTLYRTGKKTYWTISRILFKIMATRRRSARSRRSSISHLHRWSPIT